MLPRSCPRCGGWTMHQSALGLIESSCVICGWVIYREILPRKLMMSSSDDPDATEKGVADDPEHFSAYS